MRILLLLGAAALLLVQGPAGAAITEGPVQVSYVKPDQFVDVPRSPVERERLLKEFDRYFESLGKRLPAGQQLSLEITDIDLAGRIEPSSRYNPDLRVLTGGADWPRVTLTYRLEQDGRVLDSGSATVSNMNYLNRMNRYGSGETLRYEKQMLDEWFDKKFAAPASR